MRRGVWVVLGLMGVAPGVALAQEARRQPAGQAQAPEQVSNEALQQQISELWQGFRLLQQEVAALREEGAGRQGAPAVGGSGQEGGNATMGGSGQVGGTAGGSGQVSGAGGAGQGGSAATMGGSGPVGGAAGGSGQIGGAAGGSGQAGGNATTGGSGQAGTAAADEEPSDLIIVEMPARAADGSSGQAAGQGRSARAGTAMGGSGVSAGNQAPASAPDEQVFLGRVRSITEDRLLMVDPRGHVFEFDLSKQTRVMGPGGASVSLRSLREGTPVRTVAREAEERSQVLILQVLEQAPKPSR